MAEGKGSRSKAQLLAAFIVGCATVVAALIGANQVGHVIVTVDPESIPTPSARPSATVTVTVTAEPADAAGPAKPAEPADGGTPETSVTYLEDLETVEDMLGVENAELGGITYPHSLINLLAGCSQTGPVDWVLPAGASRVLAEVGVDPASVEPDSKVTFLVYLDGQQLRAITLGVGEHESLSELVSPGARMRFETRLDEERRSNCNTEATAVWGDARIEIEG